MSNNNASSSSVAVVQKAVKQLSLEAKIRRINVSQAATDLKNFCLQNGHKDPLLVGGTVQRQPLPPAQVLRPPLNDCCLNTHSEKIILPESGEKYAQIKYHLQAVLNKLVDLM